MKNSQKIDRGISLLLEQTTRAVYDKRAPSDIHPGQWAALRYFAQANRSARTVAGLGTYLGVTSGPASRAVNSLIKNDLLEREINERDRRSSFLALTAKGRATLDDDPIERLAKAVSQLDQKRKLELAETIERVFNELTA